jgi:hypothetical protein
MRAPCTLVVCVRVCEYAEMNYMYVYTHAIMYEHGNSNLSL